MSSTKSQHAQWLGLISYKEALRVQQDSWKQVHSNKNHLFIHGLEHPTVITLGKSAPQRDFGSQISIETTDRGGQETLHSPGQLVIYPIFHLQTYKMDVRSYVTGCLRTTQKVLKKMGLESQCNQERPGIYVRDHKLAFIGIRIEQGITRHGLAINISNDLTLFRHIVPCGVANERITSLQQEGLTTTPEHFFKAWAQEFIEFASKA